MADEIRDNADGLTKEFVLLLLEACGVDKPSKSQIATASANAAEAFKARLLSDNPTVVHDAMKELNNLRFRVKQLREPPDVINIDAVRAVRHALEGGENADTVATPERAAQDAAKVRREKLGPEERTELPRAGEGDFEASNPSAHKRAVEAHEAGKKREEPLPQEHDRAGRTTVEHKKSESEHPKKHAAHADDGKKHK